MTVTASSSPDSPTLARSISTYQRLLVLYPKSFREEYGADMVQAFGDLTLAASEPGRVWRRVFGDLAISATRQRFMQMAGPGGETPWSGIIAILIVVAGFALALGSGGEATGLAKLTLLLVLPAIGVGLLWNALHVWRSTGTLTVGRVLGGAACLVTAAAIPLTAMEDWGYWMGVGIVLYLIAGLGSGAIWGIATLIQSRQTPTPSGRKWAAGGLILAAVVVLGGMAGAGFNSYLNSRPPPGDHSEKNASVESRELWDAAHTGDVAVVVASIEACADPFVHFDDGGRARSGAEFKTGAEGGETVGEPMLSEYGKIIDLLQEFEDEWSETCNS